MKTSTQMRLRFAGTTDANLTIEIISNRIGVVNLELDASSAWTEALQRKLKRSPSDKEYDRHINKIRVESYDPVTKLPGSLKVGSLVKLYINELHGQPDFWRGEVIAIEEVHVSITH
jgi:hypothetical protein